MQIAIISTALAIVLFLCLYLGFRQGLRLGMQTAKGQIPPKLDPIGAVTQTVAECKGIQIGAQGELLRGFGNMMAFNGDLSKEE